MSIKPLYEFDPERRRLITKMHLEMPRGGEATGPIEGAYGEIYSILLGNSGRTRVAAKSPRVKRFGSFKEAKTGVEQVLHELEKTHRVFMVPWINRFFDVQIIHGWPFILSRYRDGSLAIRPHDYRLPISGAAKAMEIADYHCQLGSQTRELYQQMAESDLAGQDFSGIINYLARVDGRDDGSVEPPVGGP